MLSGVTHPFTSSSETLCEESLININSSSMKTVLVNKKLIHITHNKPSNDQEWGSYLAGLIEGNGYFSAQNQIVISFSEADKPHADFLCAWFKHGYVYPNCGACSGKPTADTASGKRACIWVISDIAGVTKMLNLINGHIRTPYKLSQVRKNMPYFKDLQLDVDNSPLLESWWLAGFSDANSCFYVQIINKDKHPNPSIRVHFKFSLSDKTILTQLAKVFGSTIGTRKHKDKMGNIFESYYWSSSTHKAAYKVHNYFHKHSLQSTKWLNFLKCREVLRIIHNKQHLSAVGLEKIKKLISGMNIGANYVKGD